MLRPSHYAFYEIGKYVRTVFFTAKVKPFILDLVPWYSEHSILAHNLLSSWIAHANKLDTLVYQHKYDPSLPQRVTFVVIFLCDSSLQLTES